MLLQLESHLRSSFLEGPRAPWSWYESEGVQSAVRGRASLQTPGLEKRAGCPKDDPFLHLSSTGKKNCPWAPILPLEVVGLVCFLKQIHMGDKCMYLVILTIAEQEENV